MGSGHLRLPPNREDTAIFVRYILAMEPDEVPEPRGFSELSKADQIRYLQVLWDRIAENPDDVPVPDSHLDIAETRLAAYRREPSAARPARDALSRLAKKR